MNPRPVLQRFWNNVGPTTSQGCWPWTGAPASNGYGRMMVGGRTRGAHVLSYQLFFGGVPAELQIDHLCRNPLCVNPDHLEAVPSRVNVLRSMNPMARNARKTHCHRGHPFDEENTLHIKLGRACRACQRACDRARYVPRSRKKKDIAHGTTACYKTRGCRCTACRSAHAENTRRYRAARRAT